MDKRTALVASAIIIVIASALAYAVLNKPAEAPRQETAQQPLEAPRQPSSPAPSADVPGVYMTYSAEVVASAKGDILLFFHAPWCPQCREIEKSIESTTLPENLTILKIDYDSNQTLRQQYGVTLQTTFVKVDNSGNKIKSYVAYEEPSFDSVKRELL